MPVWLASLAAIGWRVLVLAGVLVVGLLLMAQLHLVIMPVFVALLLTTLLAPASRWLRQRRVPPAAAAAVVVVASVVALVGTVALLAPPVADELGGIGEEVAEGGRQALNWLIDGPLDMSPEQVDRLIEQATEQARSNGQTITSGVLSGAVVAAELLAGLLLTVVLVFFFIKDGDTMTGWVLERAPADRRAELVAVSRRAWQTLSGYVRGIAIVALADALGVGLGLLLIGVPLVLPLMVLTFIGGFFPVIGATVAGAVAILVALVSSGPIDALLTAVVVVAVQQLESNFLQPVVMGRAVQLHPVVILLAITAGAVLGGVIGAFLSVPTAAVIAAVGNELRLRRKPVTG